MIIQINPNEAQAYTNKGIALRHLGKFNEAIKMYDYALYINPNDAQTYTNKGIALANLGKFDEAITMYNRAIKINPNDATAYNNKGDELQKFQGISLRNLGKFNEAIKMHTLANQINQNVAHTNKANKGNDLKRFQMPNSINNQDQTWLIYDQENQMDSQNQKFLTNK